MTALRRPPLGESAEVAKLHDLSQPGIERRQIAERLIQCEEVTASRLRRADPIIQDHFQRLAGPLRRPPSSRVVGEDAGYQLRRHAKERRAILPRDAVLSDRPQKRFVHQRRGFERVVPALLSQVTGGAASQLAIHERHEIVARLDVATAPGAEEIAGGVSPIHQILFGLWRLTVLVIALRGTSQLKSLGEPGPCP